MKLLEGAIFDEHLAENQLSHLRIYPIFSIPIGLPIDQSFRTNINELLWQQAYLQPFTLAVGLALCSIHGSKLKMGRNKLPTISRFSKVKSVRLMTLTQATMRVLPASHTYRMTLGSALVQISAAIWIWATWISAMEKAAQTMNSMQGWNPPALSFTGILQSMQFETPNSAAMDQRTLCLWRPIYYIPKAKTTINECR